MTVTARSGSIDVHMVTHDQAAHGRAGCRGSAAGLTLRRRLYGAATAVILLPLLTLVADRRPRTRST